MRPNRLLPFLLSSFLLLPCSRAQDLLGLTVAAPGPSSTGPLTVEPSRRFVIGRDNLGFANLSGAISIRGMSGNCYTMAAVSKLFYEAADFYPEELVSPALRIEDVAGTLASGSYPHPGFPVRGFPNLYELSTAPPGVSAESWMEGWARYRAGLDPRPPEGPTPINLDAMTTLYQMISTIHYLHYVQFQANHLISSAVAQALEGGASVPRVMEETIDRIKVELNADRLPLVCIFNPRPSVFYGHVVLAYKLVETPGPGGHTDIYVYDSNAQYAGSRGLPESELDESILRVHRDGRLELKARTADGTIRDLGMYRGDDWFEDPDATVLLVLDNLESDPALRSQLAGKLLDARENSGYLLAVGDLLGDLTTRSPAESDLLRDVSTFLRAVTRIDGGTGLAEGAGVEEVNRFLAANTDQAVRTMIPVALPDGVKLEDVSLRFDPADTNRARLRSTLTVSRSASVDAIVRAVHASALVGDEDFADLVEGVSRAFEGQVIRLTTDVEITKGRAGGRLGKWGPVPVLKGSHLVVGDLEGGEMAAGDDHRIEIAEDVVGDFVRFVLDQRDVIGERIEHDYEVPALGDRSGYVVVDDVRIDCREPLFFEQRGSVGIRVGYHGFAAVATRNRGVTLRSSDTTLWVKMRPAEGRNRLEVRGYISGDHRVRTGLEWVPFLGSGIDAALRAFMGEVFDHVDEKLDEMIEDELSRYIELVGPGPRLRNLEVDSEDVSLDVEAFTVDIEKSLARVLGFDPGRIPVALTGVDFMDDRIVVRLRND